MPGRARLAVVMDERAIALAIDVAIAAAVTHLAELRSAA